MGLRDQMESIDHLEVVGDEISKIQDEIPAILDSIKQKIKESEDRVCSEIKKQILSEGKSNGFEITDDGSVWSMKYKTLEYKGDFRKTVKQVTRKKSEQETMICFFVDIDKAKPKKQKAKEHAVDITEQKKMAIKIEQDYLSCLKEHLTNFDKNCIRVKYNFGDKLQDTQEFYDGLVYLKELQVDVTVDELVKLIIG
jgi:nitrogen regulatory protein PII-like uncharacterized protein